MKVSYSWGWHDASQWYPDPLPHIILPNSYPLLRYSSGPVLQEGTANTVRSSLQSTRSSKWFSTLPWPSSSSKSFPVKKDRSTSSIPQSPNPSQSFSAYRSEPQYSPAFCFARSQVHDGTMKSFSSSQPHGRSLVFSLRFSFSSLRRESES